jgi:hypothetical protein
VKLSAGRYSVQAVVIGAGTQQSAFGRAYLALQEAPASSNAGGTSSPNPSEREKPPTP